MKTLFIMSGCPGLGKSTWIKNNLSKIKGYTKVVSRDEIRFSLVKEDEEYFSKETEVYNEFINEIKEGLKNYDNVIADATHLNRKSRKKLLDSLGNSLNNVSIYVIVIRGTLEKALERNENRKRTRSYVPRDAIHRMFYAQTAPCLEEGFDKIYIYNEEADIKYAIIEKGE